MSETVTIQRGTPRQGRYSAEATDLDWSSPTETEAPCLGFNPGGSTEVSAVWRVAVSTQPTVYLPTGTDITPADRVVVRGVTYEVDGDPADWRSPYSGWRPGLSVALKRFGG